MQYVPSLPPLVEPVPNQGEVRAVAATAAVHRPEERTLPPMVYRLRSDHAPVPAVNRRSTPQSATVESERRKSCRRLRTLPILQELRSGVDRRRHNQRLNDITTAIDEKI